jgi:hypothetical protein
VALQRAELLEIEIAKGFLDRLVLRLFQGFFKLASEDIFLFLLGFPRLAEFVFSALGLLLEDAGGVGDVHIGRSSWRRFVGEDHGELRIHGKFGVAARTGHFEGRSGLLGHEAILRQMAKEGAAGWKQSGM